MGSGRIPAMILHSDGFRKWDFQVERNRCCERAVIKWILTLVTLAMLNLPYGYAQENGPAEIQTGLSGKVQMGGVWMETNNQLNVHGANRRNQDLEGSGDYQESMQAFPLFEFSYRFDAWREAYLKTPFSDNGYAVKAGYIQALGTAGGLDMSLFISPLQKVWKDPYLIAKARQETQLDDFGIDLAYNRIGGSGLSAGYTANWNRVHHDNIGERFDALERDGIIHSTSLKYSLFFGKTLSLTPGVRYSRAQLDGASERYHEYRGELALQRFSEKWLLLLQLSAGSRQFDHAHPIFETTRRDTDWGALAMVTFLQPFGWQRCFLNVGAGRGVTQSEIDFFDQQSTFLFSTVGYSF